MRPSLEALSTLVAIVEAGGISPAARRLGTVKSVVSKRLSELEAAAGAELVRRSGRGAVATDAGEAFYRSAKRILAELDSALEESSGAGELRGPLRVAAPLSFSNLYLSDIFSRFVEQNPAVALTLDCDDRRTDIRGGGYDFAIRIGPLAGSALIARKIAVSRLAVLASPAYLTKRGPPQSPADLPSHPVIGYGNAAMPHQWRFTARAEHPGVTVTVEPRLTVNSGEIIRDAVLAGLGIAILPLFMVTGDLADGRLVRLLPHYPLEDGPVSAVWLPQPAPSRRARVLIDLLTAEIPKRLAAAGAL